DTPTDTGTGRCSDCDPADLPHGFVVEGLSPILSLSWQIYTRHLGLCLVATAVDLGSTLLSVIVVLIPALLCISTINFVSPVLALALCFLVLILGGVVTLSATTVGHYRFFLSLVRDQPIEFSDMLRFDQYVGRMAVGSTIFWSFVVVGLMAGILPGLLILVFLWPYGRLIVDRDLGVAESFSEAFRLTTENSATSFFLFVIYALVLLGSNSIPLLGFFFAVPLMAVVHSVAYQSFLKLPFPFAPQGLSEFWGRKKLA
ncbi:MAG: hypothetical protein KDA80_19115, partial [Planctomycetaceae bacterium]|nr:hypothetical protein [Planctomycetaceae bacterium]